MSLHQDKDERDFTAPIVSFSLGPPAVFLFGGLRRSDRAQRIHLESGDVVVWGGPARMTYNGVAPLADGYDPLTGQIASSDQQGHWVPSTPVAFIKPGGFYGFRSGTA